MFESPAASECMVFDLPRSVSFVDHAGNVIWANPQSASLRPLPADVLVRLHGHRLAGPLRLEYDGVTVELLPTTHGTLVVAERDRGLATLAELAIQRLVFEADRDRGLAATLQATARIGIELSGWRWMGISRYLDARGLRVELRAFFDRTRRVEGELVYDTAETPCGAVVGGDGIIHVEDATHHFPADASLRELGVCEYIGMPYRVRGEAIGHVFMMVDRVASPASREEAALILRLAAGFLGPRIEQLDFVSEDQVTVGDHARAPR